MNQRMEAKLRNTLARRITARKADASRRGKLGVQARRAKMAAQAQAVEYAGTVRYITPVGNVRQVVIRSDGRTVYVDGGAVKTYRSFCAAMNRILWYATRNGKHNGNTE